MSQFNRTDAKAFAKKVLRTRSLAGKIKIIESQAKKLGIVTRNGWGQNLQKLANGLKTGKPAFNVFMKGNSKLPFWSFSELPLFSCPGAGDCLEFCYSFKAWQYPVAFCRQLQNTILMRNNRKIVENAFNAIIPAKNQEKITIRLYVDGDFSNVPTFAFWQKLIAARPETTVYGYSKSWQIILDYVNAGGQLADNYTLNLSSGSKYGDDMKDKLSKLSITRGEFVAVKTAHNHGKSNKRYESKEYHRDVRQAAKAIVSNPFSCPGKCGDCLPNGRHACGEKSFNALVAIGVH